MNKPYLVLDIETGSQPVSRLNEIIPQFDPDRRLTDPVKIKADLEKKRLAWFDGAALEAHRGQILAAGFYFPPTKFEILVGGESDILNSAWQALVSSYPNVVIVGHNILGFDLPYMIRRSLALRVTIPVVFVEALKQWNPPAEIFDTMRAWGCGNRTEMIGLDELAWHCGVGRKTGEGGDFAELYVKDPKKAIEYLKQDLKLTGGCYERMISCGL